jgi:hypothetical protein
VTGHQSARLDATTLCDTKQNIRQTSKYNNNHNTVLLPTPWFTIIISARRHFRSPLSTRRSKKSQRRIHIPASSFTVTQQIAMKRESAGLEFDFATSDATDNLRARQSTPLARIKHKDTTNYTPAPWQLYFRPKTTILRRLRCYTSPRTFLLGYCIPWRSPRVVRVAFA